MLWNVPKNDSRLLSMSEEECAVEVMARMEFSAVLAGRKTMEPTEDWLKGAQDALSKAPTQLTSVTPKDLGWEGPDDA